MVKIGIIGLGLIGSSILKKLYNNPKYELFCCSKSSFKEALNYTKNSSNNIEIIKNCDIIFICSKISKTIEILDTLNLFLNKKTIVCDVSSIKKNLLNKTYNFNFILTHPMAGSEFCGFSAGNENLFLGAKWLIEKNNKIIEEIIYELGAIPYKIDMKKHDMLCAQISHFPTILSYLLFDCADDESKKIASSGFRDTTRLAQSEIDMTLNMFNLNEENITFLFNKLMQKLNSLKNSSDDEKIKIFKRISDKRKEMYDINGKNNFKI